MARVRFKCDECRILGEFVMHDKQRCLDVDLFLDTVVAPRVLGHHAIAHHNEGTFCLNTQLVYEVEQEGIGTEWRRGNER